MDDFWIKKYTKKLNVLLASSRFREVLLFLLFLCFSAAFWVATTIDEVVESTVDIRVKVVDIPEDVTITEPCTSELTATVRDRGTAFFHYWRHRPEPVQIPFNRFRKGAMKGHVALSTEELIKMAQNNLLSSSKIQRLSPDSLEMFYGVGEQKQMPVCVLGNVEVSSGYYLRELSPQPATVAVQGPASILDTLRAVYTIPVDLKDLTKSTVAQAPLLSIRGVQYSQSKVNVEASVDVYMENTITVPILVTNFPANKTLRIFPAPEVKVTYTVGYANHKDIDAESFVILITYEQILRYQRQGLTKIPLQLRNVPQNISNVRLEPQEVDYLIETVNDDEE